MEHYRHGDISFHPVKKAPAKAKKEVRDSYIAAYGEATGHVHELTFPRIAKKAPPKMTIYTCDDGRRFVEFDHTANLDHPEHGRLALTRGVYEIKEERTFDYFENSIKKVID